MGQGAGGTRSASGVRSRRARARTVLFTGLAVAGLVVTTVPAANAQDLPEVPRNKTFVFSPWGFVTELPTPENWNVYNQGTGLNKQREMGLKGIYEALFYTNLNSGELIPWQGESYTYNDDFTEITLKLRDGVTWCDGVAMTSDDVKYTLELLRDAPATITYSAIYKEWLKEVEVVDPTTSIIKLNKPGPRFFRDNLALGHENHQVIMPKHLWEPGIAAVGGDITMYNDYDLAAGLPCGTGPYKVVKSDSLQMVADRRETWWGMETGFKDRLPAPERLILIPVADDTSMSQLHIANQIDHGNPLQPGTFVAAQGQNPNLRSWSAEGPVWGAPDGCGYNLLFNNMKAPWNDVNVRLAVNYAINRQDISDISYEGANYPIVLPFSAYMAPNWVPGEIQALLDKYDRGTPSQAKVEEHMALAGYALNGDGKWAKDGTVLNVPVFGPEFFKPSFELLSKQLNDAGFDSAVEISATDSEWVDRFLPGNHETLILVHCGSLAEPFDTYKDLHSKWSAPIGTNLPGSIIAGQRYVNPELDEILDKMEAIQADNTPGSEYMNLAVAATDIYLRDMPEIMLTEELHVVTYNTTYWTGYPDATNPYIAPYPCWEAINLMMHELQPTGAA